MSQLKSPTERVSSPLGGNKDPKPVYQSKATGGKPVVSSSPAGVVNGVKKSDSNRAANGASPNNKSGLNAGAKEFVPASLVQTSPSLNPLAAEFKPLSIASMPYYPPPLNYENPILPYGSIPQFNGARVNPKSTQNKNSPEPTKALQEINHNRNVVVLQVTETKNIPSNLKPEESPCSVQSTKHDPETTNGGVPHHDNTSEEPQEPVTEPSTPSLKEEPTDSDVNEPNDGDEREEESRIKQEEESYENASTGERESLGPIKEEEPEVQDKSDSEPSENLDKGNTSSSEDIIDETESVTESQIEDHLPDSLVELRNREIVYDDQSYNPANPSGKKMYSKEFLLQFKTLYTEKPSNMHDLPELKPVEQEIKLPRFGTSKPPSRDDKLKRSNERTLNSRSRPGNNRPKTPKASRKSVLKQQQESDEEKLSYQVLSILNKLTPEVYPKLFKQLREIDISKESNLSLIVNLIYSKAVSEPRYCELYAKLCSDFVKSSSEKVFRQSLLTCCQKSFENKKSIPEIPSHLTEQQKIEAEENATKIRIYNLGNIKFIGELFKLSMLQEKIMFYCLDSLLATKTETDLEHFCLLLSTVGKLLDIGDKLSKYFASISQLTKDGSGIPARIRFLLMGIVDLRNDKWVPRRSVEGPKAIKDIHEAEKKPSPQSQKKSNDLRINSPGNLRLSPGNRDSPRKANNNNSGRVKSPTPSPSPSVLLKATDAGWGNRGKTRITPVSSPRLSLLRSDDSSSDILESSPSYVLKSDRSKMIDSNEESTDSLSRGNSVVLYPEHEVISNSQRIISDYFEEESPEDAVDSLKPYINSCPSMVVSQIFSIGLEKKEKDRKLIIELFPYLKHCIIQQDFEKAFDESLGSLEDLVYDIPKAADYMGYYLSHAVLTQCISECFIKPTKIKEFNISNNQTDGLLGVYFKTIYQKDHSLLQTVYNPFNDTLQNFVKDGKIEEFLKVNGLEHLLPLRSQQNGVLTTGCSTPSRGVLSTRSLPENRISPPISITEQLAPLTQSSDDVLHSLSEEFVPPDSTTANNNPEINQENYLRMIPKPRGRGAGKVNNV